MLPETSRKRVSVLMLGEVELNRQKPAEQVWKKQSSERDLYHQQCMKKRRKEFLHSGPFVKELSTSFLA